MKQDSKNLSGAPAPRICAAGATYCASCDSCGKPFQRCLCGNPDAAYRKGLRDVVALLVVVLACASVVSFFGVAP